MGVLFITHKYPPAIGGMEKQSYELIKGFSETGQHYAICHDGSTSVIWFFLTLRRRVHKMLKRHPEISLIHLNDGLMGAFFYLLRINNQGRKIAITFHGLDLVFPLPWYQKYILPQLRSFDAFICVSTATGNACKERGFSADKIFVVNNGIHISPEISDIHQEKRKNNLAKLGLNTDTDIILLSVGRPVKRKGFSWFVLEVMPLLDDRFTFVHIGNIGDKDILLLKWLPKSIVKLFDLFTGRPSDTAALIEAASQHKNVVLAGKVNDEVRDAWICAASLMLMPNIKDQGDMEGFGLVALEASVQGKIVLASGIEGITDAVHDGKNGYLLPAEDAHAWAHKIRTLAQHNQQYNPEVQQYTSEHFSWNKMVDGYKKVFAEMEKTKF